MLKLTNETAITIVDDRVTDSSYQGSLSATAHMYYAEEHHFSSSAAFLVNNANEYDCFLIPTGKPGIETLIEVYRTESSNVSMATESFLRAFVRSQSVVAALVRADGIIDKGVIQELTVGSVGNVPTKEVDGLPTDLSEVVPFIIGLFEPVNTALKDIQSGGGKVKNFCILTGENDFVHTSFSFTIKDGMPVDTLTAEMQIVGEYLLERLNKGKRKMSHGVKPVGVAKHTHCFYSKVNVRFTRVGPKAYVEISMPSVYYKNELLTGPIKETK